MRADLVDCRLTEYEYDWWSGCMDLPRSYWCADRGEFCTIAFLSDGGLYL